MRSPIRTAGVAAALLATLSAPAAAQAPSLVNDLVKQLTEAEEKVVKLAKAMPESAWGWRAGQARSAAEVFHHVAADNYFIPAVAGVPAPAATGITTEYKTAQAYETRKANRTDATADLERSFAHLKQAIQNTSAAQLGETINAFGTPFTRQQFWILAVTHVHEHLGQLIAYARANNITPPWSN